METTINLWFVLGIVYIVFWFFISIVKTINETESLWYCIAILVLFTIPFVLGYLSKIN